MDFKILNVKDAALVAMEEGYDLESKHISGKFIQEAANGQLRLTFTRNDLSFTNQAIFHESSKSHRNMVSKFLIL